MCSQGTLDTSDSACSRSLWVVASTHLILAKIQSLIPILQLYCINLLLLYNKLPQIQHVTQIYLIVPKSQRSWCGFVGSSAQSVTRLKSRCWLGRQSHKAQSPLPSSLTVGRIQFLMAIGLRPSAPRGCTPVLAMWPSPQDGSLLL